MKSFPYPDPSYGLTEKERDQMMLIYHTFKYYEEKQLRINQGPSAMMNYRRKKIEEYQKKVLTNS